MDKRPRRNNSKSSITTESVPKTKKKAKKRDFTTVPEVEIDLTNSNNDENIPQTSEIQCVSMLSSSNSSSSVSTTMINDSSDSQVEPDAVAKSVGRKRRSKDEENEKDEEVIGRHENKPMIENTWINNQADPPVDNDEHVEYKPLPKKSRISRDSSLDTNPESQFEEDSDSENELEILINPLLDTLTSMYYPSVNQSLNSIGK